MEPVRDEGGEKGSLQSRDSDAGEYVGVEFRHGVKSDLRNHQAIAQPRVYDCLMVTRITGTL
jgi:hypothetical protein